VSRALAVLVVERETQVLAYEQLWFPDMWLGVRGAPLPRRRRRSPTKQRLIRPKQLRFKWPRKCSSLPRARSITSKRLTREERKQAEVLAFLEVGWDANRPVTRADCEGIARPCPWVSCRYNLYLDVADNGSVKINFPGREPGDMPATGSCVLDVADRVAQGDTVSLEEVGKLMNLGIERVRQISSLALQGARVKTMWEEQLVKVRVPPAARSFAGESPPRGSR
jgi:hypothetical protein